MIQESTTAAALADVAGEVRKARAALTALYGNDPRLSEAQLLRRLAVASELLGSVRNVIVNTDAGNTMIKVDWA